MLGMPVPVHDHPRKVHCSCAMPLPALLEKEGGTGHRQVPLLDVYKADAADMHVQRRFVHYLSLYLPGSRYEEDHTRGKKRSDVLGMPVPMHHQSGEVHGSQAVPLPVPSEEEGDGGHRQFALLAVRVTQSRYLGISHRWPICK